MIGLRRHTVRVVAHDDAWAGLAAEACRAAAGAGGGLLADVQHVGSTAVPGLPAKPILDLAAGVRDWAAIPALVERLVRIGYIDRGMRQEGDYLLVRESAPDVRTVHLHVVLYEGQAWSDYLFFRDQLRQDVALCRAYAALKAQLVRAHGEDRAAYTAAKAEFIRDVLSRASHAGR